MYSFIVILQILLIGGAFAAQPKLQPEAIKESFITGGQSATPGQFPWQVSLRITDAHYCGASIINTQWLLTAAHCVVDEIPSAIKAFVGSNLLSAGIKHDITIIRTHENYSRSTLAHDISVLRVTPNIALNNNAQPIPLINRDVTNQELHVSGWGRVSTSGTIPVSLQFTTTIAISNNDCQRLITINEDNVCTAHSNGFGICFEDAGGPLVKYGEGLVGVSSFVVNGCGSTYPDGFSSVYYHRTWIINNTS